ncbi:MAG TPA: NAD(P)/FAD-dependent oxidoreductase, partial [Candidatus Omnitrophota bacterium]|nr:NAD(P)/FAD-dependent oxidoreductase [Candidatus Omnitrophota bacterium]
MGNKIDVLIVGGGPAGVVSALTVKEYYPSKNVLLMKDIADGVIPCGIPYMFASLNNPEENKLGMASLEKNNVKIVVDKALKIDRKNKVVETVNQDKYYYEKLILAVGSTPIVLPIKGIEKQGVYSIYKDLGYLKNIINKVKQCKNVLVIGGGFIGVEFADELSKLNGIKVSLVEMLPHLLANSFDEEFSAMAEIKLKKNGVRVLTNTRVDEIIGVDKVERVRFSNGEEQDFDGIILGVGSKPNVELATGAGLEIGQCKGILVDEYMRTTGDKDIFAIGDCSCKRDFYT